MKSTQTSSHTFILRLLRWFCPTHLLEEIEGDLLQRYEGDVKKLGERNARRRLLWNVIRFCRPGIILRIKKSNPLNHIDMFSSYFKIMLRNMSRQKGHALVKVLGLTAGISFALLIGTFIWTELQVNQQLKDVERLYIIEQNIENSSRMGFFAPTPLVKVMKEEYPSVVENYYRFYDRNIKVSHGDKHFIIQGMIGDSTFLDFLGLPILFGNSNQALQQPNAIVITEKIALQFFNRSEVIGESLFLSSGTTEQKEFIITAVLPTLQRNSVSDLVNINAQIFITLDQTPFFLLPDPNNWRSGEMISYLKLTEQANLSAVNKMMASLINIHGSETQKKMNLRLVGLEDYYLITFNGAAQKMIYLLSGIACFLVLLAVINFINISIASASSRLKETGVRKVVGGLRKEIVFQFMLEALSVTIFSGFLSMLVYELSRVQVSDLLNTTLPTLIHLPVSYWMYFGVILISIGWLAGAYPALVIASSKIMDSLNRKQSGTRSGSFLSKALVTTQFALALFISICAIVITTQVSYFLKKDLGYDKLALLTVSSVPRVWSDEGLGKMNAAKEEFLRSSFVESASLSWEIPNGNNGDEARIYKYGDEEDKAILMPILRTDQDFSKVYQLEVVKGKFFYDDAEPFQPNTVVINESAAKILTVAIGDKVIIQNRRTVTVVGIIRDFNFFSLREPVKPLLISHVNDAPLFRFFTIRLRPGNLMQSVEAVEGAWRKIFPEDPFDYAFMDDRLELMYKTEKQLKAAATAGSAIMTLIVLMGVLGLVALNVTQRKKEIGIRKVLGASTTTIQLMLSREFMKMIGIAFLFSIALSIYPINQWLAGFAYRISVTWWMYLVPCLVLLTISFVLILLQSYRAAAENPVESLKYH